jgi:hypothetical protein
MSYVTLIGWRSPRRGRLVTILVAASALIWLGRASAQDGGVVAAASKSISTNISKADAVDATDQVCAPSGSFSDIPGMLVSFKSGGAGSRPVIVLFQGEWFGFADSSAIEIGLTIDGIVQSGPARVTVEHRTTGSFDEFETHGFNFLSDRLAPGLHVGRIQWRRSGASGQACVGNRSLIVLHK